MKKIQKPATSRRVVSRAPRPKEPPREIPAAVPPIDPTQVTARHVMRSDVLVLNANDPIRSAAELIEDLSVASRDGRLVEALGRYVVPHVLVVDEVGYLTYGHDAANVLYHVVTKRHQAKRSMIFTSNKHPDAWGAVLHDDDLAAAIVDRVLERGRLLHMDGPSIRTNHLGLDAPAHADAGSQQVVRISGTNSSEFPEPTSVDRERAALRGIFM